MAVRFIAVTIVFLSMCCAAAWGQSSRDFVRTLNEHGTEKGLIVRDIADFSVVSNHTSSNSGAQYLYLQQRHEGIEVDGAIAVMTILGTEHHLDLSRWHALHTMLKPRGKTSLKDMGWEALEKIGHRNIHTRLNLTHSARSTTGHDPRYNLVEVRPLWSVQGDSLIFCAELRYLHLGIPRRVLTTAQGRILKNYPVIYACAHHHVSSECTQTLMPDAPIPPLLVRSEQYQVYPLGSSGPLGASQRVVDNPADPKASPFGWHDVDGVSGPEFTDSRGNNTWVQEDTSGLDRTGYRPEGGLDLSFTFPHQRELPDEVQLDAALTNLFYWTNINHDLFFRYGFDEGAGNLQETNYSGAGQDGDPLIADGLDGANTNNAVFFPTPDGQPSRMETSVWTGSIFDAEIVIGPVHDPLLILPAVENQFSNQNRLMDNSPVRGLVKFVEDTEGTRLACDPSITNAQRLRNSIALVDRGVCFFIAKARNLEDLGAAAIIVIQNRPEGPFAMGGSDATLTIPAVMISQQDGLRLEQLMSEVDSLEITIRPKGESVGRATSFDGAVVTHEYAHGLTSRLSGGKQTVDCLLNLEQMSEGWSDYFGLMFTTNWGEADSKMTRGFASYLVGDQLTGRGIRPFPYSTDMTINPLTYEDLPNLAIPHGVGALWASMLWDMTWNMIDVSGIAIDLYEGRGGNTDAMRIIIEALMLQPCNPGFVEARDAILQAADLLGLQHYRYAIWQAFSRRGLGGDADQQNFNNTLDGIPSFELPEAFQSHLNDFTVGIATQSVKLEWSMLQEYGSEHFLIERFAEGEDTTIIAQIDAAALSIEPTRYTRDDLAVRPHVWYTYRLLLKHRDQDPILLAQDSVIMIPGSGMVLFPNPASHQLFVQAGSDQIIASINIVDALGKVVWSRKLQLEQNQRTALPLQLPAGNYFVHALGPQGTEVALFQVVDMR